jgi:signal transduction histidine kinase
MPSEWKPTSGLAEARLAKAPAVNLPLPAQPFPVGTKKPMTNRIQQILELACAAVGAGRAGIGILSAENELAEHLSAGIAQPEAAETGRNVWAKDIAQFVLGREGLVHSPDLSGDQPSLGQPPDSPTVGPFLAVPLVCLGRSKGVLYFTRPQGEPNFAPREVETVFSLRDWLEEGNLLDEAGLFSQLRLLNQVAQVTAGSLDLEHIVSATLRELDRHLPLHVCAVWLPVASGGCEPPVPGSERRSDAVHGGITRPVPGSEQRSDAVHGGPTPPARQDGCSVVLKLAGFDAAFHAQAAKLGLRGGEQLPLEQTPFGPCLGNGEARYADLTREDERRDPLSQGLQARGANASFAVPLRSGDQTVGVLQSICTRPTGFTNAQIQLLYLVADLLGPAISQCRLFGRLRAAYDQLRDTQSQLIQAEKLRALGELAGGMAHDFNNSLCGVLGFLELALVDKDLAPTLQQNLESARTCALDAAQTVRRVQDFARWQRNEVSVQLLDVNELVRQTTELTRHKWEGFTATRSSPITVDVLTEATARVYGSSAELREVLTNLIFNAIDAMPNGGRLTVRTWSSAGDTFLAVSDTGMGMTEAVRQRLFEPFFTTKGERGNGLGLSVTFGILQRYGGEIKVESELGRGSTFVVRLPAVSGNALSGPKANRGAVNGSPSPTQPESSDTNGALQAAAAAPGANASRLGPPGAAAPRLAGLRILVIEDEEAIRRFLDTALTRLGHRPTITADPAEGLSAFKEEHFDLVLTDFGLPGMNGEEVARAVHRESPQTPVILLTGWSNQLKAEAKPMEGVRRLIGKPVTLQILAKTIDSLC